MYLLLSLSVWLAGAGLVTAYRNGLALTPQMGWNTWNYFGCNVSETTILTAAQAVVSNGLKDLGYEYIVMDDCWHAPTRDPATGAPRPDPTRFPNGIKAVADQVHGLGLKFGIYSDAGMYTCGGRFGSLGYEEIDAQTYSSWGVDYLKYDNCYNEGRSGVPLISYHRYANMSRALNATGRPIFYSMCNWGEDGPWNWAPTIANSWRISGDIFDNFDRPDDRCPCTSAIGCLLSGYHCSVTNVIEKMAPLGQKAGPGNWNDADMLEVGNGGMTYDEYVVHFSFWAIMKSPLILGNDVTHMTNDTLEIISNKAIIAVNQDSLGSPVVRIWKQTMAAGGDLQLWAGPLSDGSTVIGILNTSPNTQSFNLSMADVFEDSSAAVKTASYQIYDLWQKNATNSTEWGKDIGTYSGMVQNVTLPMHTCLIYKAMPVAAPSRRRSAEF